MSDRIPPRRAGSAAAATLKSRAGEEEGDRQTTTLIRTPPSGCGVPPDAFSGGQPLFRVPP